MKVLWFANVSGNSDITNANNRGGWIASLETAILENTDIELYLAFPSDKTCCKLSDRIAYYAIQIKHNTKAKRLIQRYIKRLPDEIPTDTIINLIEGIRPDIIHIHGTENPFGSIIGRVKIPAVISIQGNITVISKKYFSGISRKTIIKNTRVLDYFLRADYLTRFELFQRLSIREKEILKASQYIIGRTDWDKRIMKILAPDAKYFHGDEILRSGFYESQWTSKKGGGVYRIVSILGPDLYKGLETILQSADLLLERKLDFKWHVAGIKHEDRIVKIIESQEKVSFKGCGIDLLGSLSQNSLIGLMLNCDLFVSPSHIENSPNNVCEAMLLGMPIVATYAGGTGSLLKDRKEGILIQDGDPYVMAGAILEMSENEQEVVSLGVAARNRALDRHNQRNIARDYINIYNEIIQLAKSGY